MNRLNLAREGYLCQIVQSMGISKLTTDKVKERVDIVEVVGDYVPLKKKGQNMWACCPFHNEKSPSFSISPAKQIYKCFGCGKAGDPIQFVMDIEGIGFTEAIRHLAGKYGIEVEEDQERTPEQDQAQSERESLYIALGFARDFFVKNLQTEEGKSIGLSYFKERGFTPGIIEKFDLGFALDGWDHLLKAAKSAGFQEDILLKAGLILQKEGDPSRVYDRFRGRVTFTIHNIGGKPIGFGARILTKDKNQPKYINSPETAVYHKSDVLYGMYQAKKAIREKDNCYLVEGYTDVVSLHLSGIENVVASSGTSLTDGQIKLIKRFTDQVTVLYDGDSAGIKASLRGIDLLLEGGLNVKAVVFPDGEDPDSYSRKVGSQAFQDYLQSNAKDFIGFKIGLFKDEFTRNPIRKAEVIREVIQSIGKIPDPIIRSVYAKEAATLLEVEEDVIHAELNKTYLKSQNISYRNEVEQISDLSVNVEGEVFKVPRPNLLTEAIFNSEEQIIKFLILFGHHKFAENQFVYQYINEQLSGLTLISEEFQNIFYLALNHFLKEKNEFLGSNSFYKMRNDFQSKIYSYQLEKYSASDGWNERGIYFSREIDHLDIAIFRAISIYKRDRVEQLIDEAQENLINENDEKIVDENLLIIQSLNSIRQQLDSPMSIVKRR